MSGRCKKKTEGVDTFLVLRRCRFQRVVERLGYSVRSALTHSGLLIVVRPISLQTEKMKRRNGKAGICFLEPLRLCGSEAHRRRYGAVECLLFFKLVVSFSE